MTECPIDLDRLAMDADDVARLTRPEREARVLALVAEAHAVLDWGRSAFITDEGKTCVATVILFSGGNDSTVLAHLFRERATHAAHANTGVGIEQTREYVRATCARWDLPLIERKVRRELVTYKYRERVIFLAGIRRTESDRRSNRPAVDRKGSTVWVSPLVNWTKPDMNTYRLMQERSGKPVPVNIVADLCHMSGECLCGAFAHYNERAEISEWYADAFDEIAELEAIWAERPEDFIHPIALAQHEARIARGKHSATPKPVPAWARTWGWSGDPRLLAMSKEKPKSGRLCQSCDTRWEQAALAIEPDKEDAA